MFFYCRVHWHHFVSLSYDTTGARTRGLQHLKPSTTELSVNLIVSIMLLRHVSLFVLIVCGVLK